MLRERVWEKIGDANWKQKMKGWTGKKKTKKTFNVYQNAESKRK